MIIATRGAVSIHLNADIITVSIGEDLENFETEIICSINKNYVKDLIAALRLFEDKK